MQLRLVVVANTALAVVCLAAGMCFAEMPVISMPHDARSNGLAGAGVADGSNPSTVVNNPAVAGRLEVSGSRGTGEG